MFIGYFLSNDSRIVLINAHDNVVAMHINMHSPNEIN